MMEMIQDLWSQFMEMTCPLWIPCAAGLAVLFIILIPLAANRGKWKKKAQDAESAASDQSRSLQSKADKELAAARKEAEKLQKESDQKLEEAQKTAQEELKKLAEENDRKVADIIRTSELDLVAVKERMERILHEERETIKVTEEELKQMDEKELLVRTMMALGGYGTRLDRMEKEINEMGTRVKYQSPGPRENYADLIAGGNGSTPLLDFLRDELNAVAQKKD